MRKHRAAHNTYASTPGVTVFTDPPQKNAKMCDFTRFDKEITENANLGKSKAKP